MLKLLFLFLLLWSCGQVLGQGTAGNEVQRYRCDSGKELLFAYRATRSDFVFDM